VQQNPKFIFLSVFTYRAIVLVSLYRAMDTDHTGVITEANLNQLVAQAGAQVSEARVHELFAKVDTQGNGQVNFKEFIVALVAHLRADH